MKLNKNELNHLLESDLSLPRYKLWSMQDLEDFNLFIEYALLNFDDLSIASKRKFMLILISNEKLESFKELSKDVVFRFLMSFHISGKNNIQYANSREKIKRSDIEQEFLGRLAEQCLTDSQRSSWINHFIEKPTSQSITFITNNEQWWDYYDLKKLEKHFNSIFNSKDSLFGHLKHCKIKEKKTKTVGIFTDVVKKKKESVMSSNNKSNLVLMSNLVQLCPDFFTLDEKVECLKAYIERTNIIREDFNNLEEDDFLNKYPVKRGDVPRGVCLHYNTEWEKELTYGGKKNQWREAWIALAKQNPMLHKKMAEGGAPILSISVLDGRLGEDSMKDGELIECLMKLGIKPSTSYQFLRGMHDKKRSLIFMSNTSKKEEEIDLENVIKLLKTEMIFSKLSGLYREFPMSVRSYLSLNYPNQFTLLNVKKENRKLANDKACEILAYCLYYGSDNLDINENVTELLSLNFKI